MKRLLWAAALGLVYLGVGVFDHDVWPPAEPAVAGVTWEMATYGDLAVPRINGMPYLEKPPLVYLLGLASGKLLGGLDAGRLRLPITLLGLASLALLFWTARRLYGEQIAAICSLLCAANPTFYLMTHRAASDGVALFFVFLCFSLFLCTLDRSEGTGTDPVPGRRAWWDLAFCAALALSFYAKNFFTYLIIVPPIAIFLLRTHQLRRLVRIGACSLALTLLALAPWSLALYRRGGLEFLRIVFFDNTFGRFFTISSTASFHLQPLNDAFVVQKGFSRFEAFEAFGIELLPWALLELAALWSLFLERHGKSECRSFLRIAFVSILLAVTIPASRSLNYYLPLVFVLVLASGEFLRDLFAERERAARWRRWALGMNLGVVAIGAALAPAGVALALRRAGFAALLLPNVAVLVWLALSFRTRSLDAGSTLAYVAFVLCAGVLTLGAAIPAIDARSSWRPFFDGIRQEAEGRRLYSTELNDRHLPAMEYYLGRRLEILDQPTALAEALQAKERVGVVAHHDTYERWRGQLAGIEYSTRRASSGKDLFVWLQNR